MSATHLVHASNSEVVRCPIEHDQGALRLHSRELYRSANLLVRSAPAEDTDRCVVAFDHYGENHDLDRPGFGESFFRQRGISAIFVNGSGNHWYQYPDMLDALAATRRALRCCPNIMTYGSSMGGYAAIRFAEHVGANKALALSPQYSRDPSKVRFETQWAAEGRSIRWRRELDGRISTMVRPVIVYDPVGRDGRHVAMIAADTPITAIGLPHTAHPVITFLASVDMLESLLLDTLAGRLDATAFRGEARRRSRTDPVYLSEMCRRQPLSRSRAATRLGERAVARAPDNPLALHILASHFTRIGAHERALPLHRRAVEISDGFSGYALPYSEALHRAGDADAALSVAGMLVRRHPGNVKAERWMARLLYLTGRPFRAAWWWLRIRARARSGRYHSSNS